MRLIELGCKCEVPWCDAFSPQLLIVIATIVLDAGRIRLVRLTGCVWFFHFFVCMSVNSVVLQTSLQLHRLCPEPFTSGRECYARWTCNACTSLATVTRPRLDDSLDMFTESSLVQSAVLCDLQFTIYGGKRSYLINGLCVSQIFWICYPKVFSTSPLFT
jgi:hypothetical protein